MPKARDDGRVIVEVGQTDRELAAAFWGDGPADEFRRRILDGGLDCLVAVQMAAFVRQKMLEDFPEANTFNAAVEVITEANNSLYGSQAFFMSKDGGPPNKYHIAEAAEEVKAYSRKYQAALTGLDEELAALKVEFREREAELSRTRSACSMAMATARSAIASWESAVELGADKAEFANIDEHKAMLKMAKDRAKKG
jgi:hypothetical protein